MITNPPEKKILIVGGGFGGVRTALGLAKKNLSNTKVILVSDKPHFEYHASLYRIVTGHSPLEVCIPLAEIFKRYSTRHSGKRGTSASRIPWRFWTSQNDNRERVEVVEDTITDVDLKEKKLIGSSGSHYTYDFLVLALGSETNYYDIPGLAKFGFGFKSITDALRLKRHIHEMFSSCVMSSDKEKECALHFVIVGGGASGTELAGELAHYTKKLAGKHQLDPTLITIDLVDANDRIVKFLSPSLSTKIMDRLKALGVGITLNNRVVREEVERVYLRDMEMRTRTVIWTAGVKPNALYGAMHGLSFDEKGRVIVDEWLQPVDILRASEASREVVSDGDSSSRLRSNNNAFENVFVIGDAAATPFSGMAQTALHQGSFVADVIAQKILGVKPLIYRPKKTFYAMPVGPNWAVFQKESLTFTGSLGWVLRRLADLQFFLSILPLNKAVLAFRSDAVLWESCPICSKSSSLSS